MFQSFIVSQGSVLTRLQKALDLLPFRTNSQQKETILNDLASNIPDIHIINSIKSIGIAEIRDIEKEIKLKPYSQKFKAIIINDADKLTPEAQNALLKTLEEPPDYLLIFLLTPDEELLLSTICSRCQIIILPSVTPSLTEKEYAQMAIFFSQVFPMEVGERLQMTKNISTKREEAIAFLEKALIFFHKNLSTPVPLINLSYQQIVHVLKSLKCTQTLLEKNINTRLSLDNMVITWPKI